MSHRVVVTGLGTVSPFGVGVKQLWTQIKANQSALKLNEKLGVLVGSIPRGEGPTDFNVNEFSTREQRQMSAASLLTLKAVEEALKDSGLEEVEQGFHDETGVNIGMGISDLEEIHRTASLIDQGKARQVGPFFVPKILTNIPAGYVALKYGMKGGNSSTTTACATGASCISDAFAQIQSGRIKRVVAGSVESSLNSISVVGFQRMRALASSTDHIKATDPSISRPFDALRNGFVLSEAAGVVILERLDDARARGATIYAEVLGYGLSNDSFHLTAPREDGEASSLCLRRCLQDAKLEQNQIGYVNAHATSTIVGDRAEAVSVAKLFGPKVPLSSAKGHLGHCVSAAGSIEAILTILTVKEGYIPCTLNLTSTDIEADVDLVKDSGRDWPSKDQRIALKNSFGFGGAFVSIAFGQI